MPWSVKDVDKHKKGLTSAQKKKWVSVANGVYKECMKTGSDKTCAARAIRVANSKFSEEGEMTIKELPKGALRFVDTGHDCSAYAFAEEGKKPKLRMKAYSGKQISDHWYWGNLALDTKGMKLASNKTPILEDHMTSKKIAFTTGVSVEDFAVVIDPEKTSFVDTECSKEFQKLSAEGFPYQCSVAGKPSVVEWVEKGSSVDVNGFSLKGPGAVWRQWELKEASVCVFGWDSKTSASAFSREETEEVELTEIKEEGGDPDTSDQLAEEVTETEEEVIIVDKEQFKKEYPEVYKAVVDEVTENLNQTFSEERENLEGKITILTQSLDDNKARVLALEKDNVLAREKAFRAEADTIWAAKLSESNVSERLYDKIVQQVTHDKFVEDNIFNVDAFTEAVDAEIKDWEDRGATSNVLGMSTKAHDENGKEAERRTRLSEENKNITNDLLKRAGQKVE